MAQQILIAEDDESLRRVMEYNLREEGYAVEVVPDGETAVRALGGASHDLLLTDLRMPGRTGLELLEEVRRRGLELEVIVLTAHGTVDDAVLAMKAGAFDFVTKPVRWDELRLTVARALERLRLRRDTGRLQRELKSRSEASRLLGESPALEALRATIARVADSSAPVFIVGESGVGKELVARALHYQSQRAAHPFVALNCGALPRELIEAELFGVKKGAFTGADRDRRGRFEDAEHGTLLLDELTELEAELQVKLLRAVETRTVAPLGGGAPVEFDVRLLASTNRSVNEALETGRLRSDLYYRLNVVTIEVPPLRERIEDLDVLVPSMLERLGAPLVQMTSAAWARLREHSWPGNVRELENALERALLFRRAPDRLDADDLPPHVARTQAASPRSDARSEPRAENLADPPATPFVPLPPEGLDIYALEEQLIRQALDRAEWNQTRAASLLGMTRQTLIYRMQKYGVRR